MSEAGNRAAKTRRHSPVWIQSDRSLRIHQFQFVDCQRMAHLSVKIQTGYFLSDHIWSFIQCSYKLWQFAINRIDCPTCNDSKRMVRHRSICGGTWKNCFILKWGTGLTQIVLKLRYQLCGGQVVVLCVISTSVMKQKHMELPSGSILKVKESGKWARLETEQLKPAAILQCESCRIAVCEYINSFQLANCQCMAHLRVEIQSGYFLVITVDLSFNVYTTLTVVCNQSHWLSDI
jgi:hypothetical protein